MDLMSSGLEIQKQMRIEVWLRAWDQDFSSKQLVPVGIFNCHTENANAMAMVLQDLSTVSFNRSYTPPANDDQQEKQQKRWKESWWTMRKKWKCKVWKIERMCEILLWIWKNGVWLWKTVTIISLYLSLIQNLIKISKVGRISIMCIFHALAKMPFSKPVHISVQPWFKQVKNTIWNVLQKVSCAYSMLCSKSLCHAKNANEFT
jgi:hypothetical protein